MSCVANADLAVTSGILGAAALRVQVLRRGWRGLRRGSRGERTKVRAET